MIEFNEKKYTCGVSFDPALSKKLKQAAHDNWRSFSQEVGLRLEESFKRPEPKHFYDLIQQNAKALNEILAILEKRK